MQNNDEAFEGVFSDNWLGAGSVPIDIPTFVSHTILDDGFANSDADVTFEVVFNGGVTNVPGADLVLFDARFDDGSYSISTDFDSFSTSIALDAAETTWLVVSGAA